MTNHALLMASATPNEDLELLAGEYAAIRPATRLERKRMKLARRAVAYTFVLRSCAGVQTIVASACAGGPSLDAGMIDALVVYFSRQNDSGAILSKSAAVMVLMLRVFPSAASMLASERPASGPCLGCRCMWSRTSVFEPLSAERPIVAGMVDASFERIAA